MKQKPLCIGVILDDALIEDWLHAALVRVLASAAVSRLVFFLPEQSFTVAAAPFAYRLFAALDARLSRRLIGSNACARRDVRAGFPDVETVQFSGHVQNGVSCLSDADLQAMSGMHLDVLVSAGQHRMEDRVCTIARWGLWSYHFGDLQRVRGTPAGFHECIDGIPTSGAGLVMRTAEGAHRVLDSFTSTTYFYSPAVNRNLLLRSASTLLARQIEKLYRLGERRFFSEIERRRPPYGFYSWPERKAPAGLAMLRVFAIYFFRIFAKSLRDRLLWEKWHLLIQRSSTDAGTLQRYHEIIAPVDQYWADPFIWRHEGGIYIFFEVFCRHRQKGHLAVASLNDDNTLSTPVTILDMPYHLSYPCLVQHDRTLYMIPESKDNNAVSLYRCVGFPHQWEFVMHLMDGVSAVDTTPFFHEGKWWLFMTVVDVEGARARENLCLFHADNLLTREWVPHPLNPVVTDARFARPAGHLFREGNRLFRPAQDCSNLYGYAVAFREIKTLTVDDYEEVACEEIYPFWSPGLLGVHTFSREEGLIVIDACRRVAHHPRLQKLVDHLP